MKGSGKTLKSPFAKELLLPPPPLWLFCHLGFRNGERRKEEAVAFAFALEGDDFGEFVCLLPAAPFCYFSIYSCLVQMSLANTRRVTTAPMGQDGVTPLPCSVTSSPSIAPLDPSEGFCSFCSQFIHSHSSAPLFLLSSSLQTPRDAEEISG